VYQPTETDVHKVLEKSLHADVTIKTSGVGVFDELFEADLAFLGNRLPDREQRVEAFFLNVAAQLPGCRFIMGGNSWHDKPMTPNVKYIGHVFTRDHNVLNCSPKAVLNVSRDSMAKYGFSPATRVFEAAGACALRTAVSLLPPLPAFAFAPTFSNPHIKTPPIPHHKPVFLKRMPIW